MGKNKEKGWELALYWCIRPVCIHSIYIYIYMIGAYVYTYVILGGEGCYNAREGEVPCNTLNPEP